MAEPSYKQGFAHNAAEAKPEHSNRWKSPVALWEVSLGITGDTLLDQSAFKNHGTLTNMAPATDWVISGNPRLSGYALDFDNSDDEIRVPANSSLNVDIGSFHVRAWINMDNVPSGIAEANEILEKKSPAGVAGNKADILFSINGDGRASADADGDIVFGFGNGTIVLTHDSLTSLSANTWYRVIGEFDRSAQKVRIYINGVLDIDETETEVPESNGYEIIIGAHYSAAPAQGPVFGGKMGSISLHAGILRGTEAMEDYINSRAMFELRPLVYKAPAAAPPAASTLIQQIIMY